MNASSCDAVFEKLVDFADGALPADESAQVAEHVADCEKCRAQSEALRRSLGLAREIWDDADAQLAALDPPGEPTERPERRFPWALWFPVSVAASVALLVTSGLLFKAGRDAPISPAPSPPVVATDTLEQIKFRIAQEGVASRMLGAADLLANQPGGEDIACERYRYVLATYPETQAATECEARLASHCEGRNGS